MPRDTPRKAEKGPQMPECSKPPRTHSKSRMFFKLRSNCGQNRVASLVKHPLQKVKNDLARVKSVLSEGAKIWCSAL